MMDGWSRNGYPEVFLDCDIYRMCYDGRVLWLWHGKWLAP